MCNAPAPKNNGTFHLFLVTLVFSNYTPKAGKHNGKQWVKASSTDADNIYLACAAYFGH